MALCEVLKASVKFILSLLNYWLMIQSFVAECASSIVLFPLIIGPFCFTLFGMHWNTHAQVKLIILISSTL